MITMRVQFEELEGSQPSVAITVDASAHKMTGLTDAEGQAWYDMCQAINRHMHDQGALDFDCLKLQPSSASGAH